MMVNIVLVHPYITVRNPETYLSEPLGLICLASYLKQVFGEEINVAILDLYAMGGHKPRREGDMYVRGMDDERQILSEIKKMNPDLVGITCCFTGYIDDALKVAAIIKKADATVPVVMGGAHVTLEAESILRNNQCVDFVVRNEGEITLEQLVRSIRGEVAIQSINGLCFRASNQEVVVNPPRELIKDLDMLPIPDRKLIDMEHYKRSNSLAFNFSRKSPIATIMTSRGCPYECVFCSTKNIWKRKWRPRSLSHVFREIEMLVSDYGIREILILDDQFILHKERIDDFCNYFIQRKLKIAFSNIAGVSAWLADDEEILVKMRQAGFYKITLPIESGNTATLKFIRKPINLVQVSKLINKANELGYWTGGFFIIGFPYETREQIRETIQFAYNSKLDFAHFFVAQPYLGTELYEVYKKEKLLGEGIIPGTFIFQGWHDTTTMTACEINEIQLRASRGWLAHKFFFYLKPKNFKKDLLPKFKTKDDFLYSLGVFMMLLFRNLMPVFKRTLERKIDK